MTVDKDGNLAVEPVSPLVSVCCISYNHAPYIEKTLKGFLAQRTTFPYEIIVHDDASSDGTREIIAEYASNYPALIRPILQSENQYSREIPVFSEFTFKSAHGKYLALCEGDDHWTDDTKLQWQVDFLEANPSIAMCTHEVIRNIDIGRDVASYRRKAAVLYRYASLYGPLSVGVLLLKSFTDGKSIEAFDLTHRDKKRKKNVATYDLRDFSDGTTHMSTCSIVIRKSAVDRHMGAFWLTPRACHQLVLLIGAVSGGVTHFHKVAAVKNDQPTSITQSAKHRELGRTRSLQPETNEKLRRYNYFLDKVAEKDRRIFERMIRAERGKMGFDVLPT